MGTLHGRAPDCHSLGLRRPHPQHFPARNRNHARRLPRRLEHQQNLIRRGSRSAFDLSVSDWLDRLDLLGLPLHQKVKGRPQRD